MKGWLGCSAVMLVVLAIIAAAVWGTFAYQGLVREQIEVEARWTRIENAYQHRVNLATHLTESVRGGTARAAEVVEPLSEACDRAAQIVLSPEILNEPARFREFEDLHALQSASIADTLSALEKRSDLLSSRSVVELRDQLEAAERKLVTEGASFNEAAERYNRVIRPFPASMIARLFDFEPKPLLEVGEETTPTDTGSDDDEGTPSPAE